MNTQSFRISRGVTLVELMIVLAILGILLGLVAPNYGTVIAERAVVAETRRMINILQLARSEARARGATVTVSRSATTDWTGSVDVYESTTTAGNTAFVAGVGEIRDDRIKSFPRSTRKITSRDNAAEDEEFISFNVSGWLSTGERDKILIAVCSPGLDDSRGKYIEINRVGKIRERSIGDEIGGCL